MLWIFLYETLFIKKRKKNFQKHLKFACISDIINRALCETDARGFAQIAQLVEQRTENPCVAGSIPALGTVLGLSKSGVIKT